MSALVVGGVTMSVTAADRDRNDNVDRRRAFDGTYRASSTGTAKRDWHFEFFLPRATADTYETTLATVTAQSCSGDLLGATVSCFSEITGWQAVMVNGGHYVRGKFSLHEA